MPAQGDWLRILLFVSAFMAAGQAAHANPYPCPDDLVTFTTPPDTLTQNTQLSYPTEHLPCETFEAVLSGTFSLQIGSAAVWLDLLDAQGQTIKTGSSTCSSAGCTIWAPPLAYERPWPGTLAPHSLVTSVRVRVGTTYMGQGDFTFSVTWMRTPRSAYNRGGRDFGEALAIPVTGTTVFGSLLDEERHYFKVRLQPGGSVSTSGVLNVRNAWYAMLFYVEVYDAAFVLKRTIVNAMALSNSGQAPGGRDTPFQSTAFTHNGTEPANYYLVVRADGWSWIHSYQMTVQADLPPPALTLFLDADQSFNLESPENDTDWYVPGSDRSAASVDLLPPATQTVQAIAAYVGWSGAVVPPPNPAMPVTYSLANTSAFKGIAMNYGDGDEPDFALPLDLGSIEVGWGDDNTAKVDLTCRDYGGFTTVHAAHNGPPAAMKIPADLNDNWIADPGWIAGTVPIDDTSLGKDLDEDNNPAVSGPPELGLIGDGLVNFEEYRGFIVRGVHRRTNPFWKDLFISSNVAGIGIYYAYPNLPTSTHRIWGEDETASPEYRKVNDDVLDRVVNANFANSGFGGAISGRHDQKALRVYSLPTNPGWFGYAWEIACDAGGTSPNEMLIIDISVPYHLWYAATVYPTDSSEQINNEIRRTVGHEVGHGVHINHRPAVPPAPCVDTADLGTVDSIMSSAWEHGPNEDHVLSNYNGLDRVQIRLHLRAVQP